jgi:hypothetical protein
MAGRQAVRPDFYSGTEEQPETCASQGRIGSTLSPISRSAAARRVFLCAPIRILPGYPFNIRKEPLLVEESKDFISTRYSAMVPVPSRSHMHAPYIPGRVMLHPSVPAFCRSIGLPALPFAERLTRIPLPGPRGLIKTSDHLLCKICRLFPYDPTLRIAQVLQYGAGSYKAPFLWPKPFRMGKSTS